MRLQDLGDTPHIKAVEALIKPLFPNVPIFSFIIFPSADKLRISGTDLVGTARDTVSKIKTYTNAVISDADKDKIYEILASSNIKEAETRKLHDTSAKALKESRGI